jgi:serine/threonine protein kinase/Tfp pilus assembly protein PilF
MTVPEERTLDRAPIRTTRPTSTRSREKELVAAIIARWQAGEPAVVERALIQYPELATEPALVLELIQEEWTLRTEAGEAPDLDDFCRRFPAQDGPIRRLTATGWYFDENSDLFFNSSRVHQLIQPPPIPWPREDELFLGFRLMRLLGCGQFAHVFLACQEAVGNRLVALKVAPQGAAEAKTLGRLSHPNIVPVYSVHQDEATKLTAICMPYRGSATLAQVMTKLFAGPDLPVDGRALQQASAAATHRDDSKEKPVRASPQQPGSYLEEVVDFVRQLAEALAHAHLHGVCHGDLKPSNVLVDSSGKPMLLDFNLALDVRQDRQLIGGTVPYMSPEQLWAYLVSRTRGTLHLDRHADLPLNPRSDLFSLGVILYELLTGTHPFLGGPPAALASPPPSNDSGPLATISTDLAALVPQGSRPGAALRRCWRMWRQQKDGMRPARQANPRLDPYLAAVLERCLALEMADRFQNAEDLAAGLAKYLSAPQRLRRWVVRRRRHLLAAGVLLGALAAVPALALAVRPSYSERQLTSGWEAYRRGEYPQALNYFQQATQADPQLAEAFFARGRAYQQLGNFQSAVLEYEQADQLVSDGRSQACLGYCQAAKGSHLVASSHFSHALEAGFDKAEVFNDLGFCYLRLGRLALAQEHLDKALARNPHLQAAYHNRLKLHAKSAVRSTQGMSTSWLPDLGQALALGPGTAELYLDVAHVYALAARKDPQWVEPALDYLDKCIERRQNPQPSKKDSIFSTLHAEARFRDLMSRLPAPLLADQVIPLLDPLTGDALTVPGK